MGSVTVTWPIFAHFRPVVAHVTVAVAAEQAVGDHFRLGELIDAAVSSTVRHFGQGYIGVVSTHEFNVIIV